MIEPRDCDGGTIDLAAAAAGYDPDARIELNELSIADRTRDDDKDAKVKQAMRYFDEYLARAMDCVELPYANNLWMRLSRLRTAIADVIDECSRYDDE